MDAAKKTTTPELPLHQPTPPPVWRGWLARIGSVVWVGLCAWALYGLYKEWSHFHLSDLKAAFARIGPQHLALALGFTALSYLCNAGLGLLGQRWIGKRSGHALQDLSASYIASAFSINAGGAVLGGGSIRVRFAPSQGLSLADVGKVTLFTSVSSWAGHVLLCGFLLCFATPPLEWLPGSMAKTVGALLLAVGGLSFFGRWVVGARWPSAGLALVAVATSVVDWLCSGLAMWALFPGTQPLGVGAFVAVVVLAHAVAAFTHVPGGMGVLELTITKALNGAVPTPVLAGALVTYRLVFYLLPFFAAMVMLGIRELRLRRDLLERGSRAALHGWSIVAPRLASLLALGGGFMLLVSANTPMEESRRGLMKLLPLPFVESSHFISSLAGALLVVLARGLQRRVQAAWWLAIGAMGAGIVFSLLKGFDWEEALVLAFMLACLLPYKDYFHRHAALWTYRFTVSWWLTLLSLLMVSVWVGFFTTRHLHYQSELWWHFTLRGDASRFMRAVVGAGCVFIVTAMAQALRPVRQRRKTSPDAGIVAALVAASSHSDAALAFLGDKEFTVSEDRRSGLMHADRGRSRVVMGDPLGDSDAADDLLWKFVEEAQDEGMRPVFYQVSAPEMPRLVDMGFKLFKLGEEAHVPIDSFDIEEPSARKLRQAYRRFQRSGLQFLIWDEAKVAASLDALREVSDSWLLEQRAGEKGFSIGSFNEDYIRRFPCAVITTSEGELVAFSNLWRTSDKTELSVDLMRHRPDAPNVMDGMFIELMLWGRAQGYHFFNLGMAPLSGLSTHPLAPLWHKLASGVFLRGEAFYNFRGLLSYKEKFNPVWEPRYVAVPSTWSLPTALLDVTALIGGGLRSTLSKDKP